MYLEPTNNKKTAYAIQDIDEETLAHLTALLNGVTHAGLNKLRDIIEKEVGRSNDRIITTRLPTIEICDTCFGSGRTKAGNNREFHNLDIEICHQCKGDGSRVKITSVRYERINDHWKNILAPMPRVKLG